jgi:hypothetical protein
MAWIIVSFWKEPPTAYVETDSEGYPLIFRTQEEANEWGNKNLMPGWWQAVEVFLPAEFPEKVRKKV